MANNYHFRNLVFEGGGVKGIAYVGALRELKKRQILANIERVAGTSAGAINAALLVLGYGPRQTTDLLLELDFENFLDDSWGIVRDTSRLVNKFGWYKGDFFRDWIGNLIKDKTGNANSTFNDLQNLGLMDLYLIVTNLTTGFSEVMSAEHTPRLPVADAVHMSMSLPLFFQAITNPRGDVYVDGGVLRNYPVKVFDREKYIEPRRRKRHSLDTKYYRKDNRTKPVTSSKFVYNKETLGFRLDREEEIAMFRDGAAAPTRPVNDFFDFGWALFKAARNAQNNAHLHSDDWQRTVYIDTLRIETTDFDVSLAKKRKLIKSGADGVKVYFDWYDNTHGKSLPNNHPEFSTKS